MSEISTDFTPEDCDMCDHSDLVSKIGNNSVIEVSQPKAPAQHIDVVVR